MFINDDLFFIEYADSVSYCYENSNLMLRIPPTYSSIWEILCVFL